MNNLATYQNRTNKTAVYPKDKEFEYLSLGLVNEIGEALDKAMELEGTLLMPNDKRRICGEIGDVLWYFSQICNFFDLSMTHMVPTNENRQPAILSTSDVFYGLNNALREASFICGIAKKYIRDNLPLDQIDSRVFVRLKAIMIALDFSCRAMDTRIMDAASANYSKLIDRAERGVLQGDGDNR